MKKYVLALLCLTTAGWAEAALVQKTISYQEGKTPLEGYLVFDNTFEGKRPGVVIVHDWMGLSGFYKERADDLARLGYVAFAADIYGKDVRPKDVKEASEMSGAYKKDRKLLRARSRAALDTLSVQPQTDPSRVAAIGYCFGGTAALELSRSGAPLVGVVSFHGGLATPTPGDAKKIKGKVLALHGADDPYVTEKEVSAFEKEMKAANVTWELVKYSGAVHAFTNPDAGDDPSKGAAYNELAATRAWERMKNFLTEIFRPKP